MLETITLLCLLSILLYGIIKAFEMQDSPNPNLLPDEDLKDEDDQGNT
jgi:hypothetical protein